MLLRDKVAVVYGGGGAIGGAAARAFAREGATVYLTGRTAGKLDAVAGEITRAGGRARGAVVDALDLDAMNRHANGVVEEAGRIDVAFGAIGIMHVQGTPLADLGLDDYEHPIRAYSRACFVMAKAVVPHMASRRSGVILTMSTQAARISFPGVLGFGTACAAIEGFARHLAAEVGPSGVRVVCLRSDALPEAVAHGSHAKDVFQPVAQRMNTTVEAMLAGESAGLLKRYPRLAEIANAAVFAASEQGGALTGTTLNLTCGASVD
ncbi:MAG: SDR family oxidoreductase [Polyangiaceae bacterium]|nr:SDR family oxidoreductase [Polyangiaceae bacterium]